MSVKYTNDPTGNGTRVHPACSAVSQPSAPPRGSQQSNSLTGKKMIRDGWTVRIETAKQIGGTEEDRLEAGINGGYSWKRPEPNRSCQAYDNYDIIKLYEDSSILSSGYRNTWILYTRIRGPYETLLTPSLYGVVFQKYMYHIQHHSANYKFLTSQMTCLRNYNLFLLVITCILTSRNLASYI